MAFNSKKTLRHGTTMVFVTLLVVVLAILGNAILTTLSERYRWYADMNPDLTYPVSDDCYTYLDKHIIPTLRASSDKMEFIFCNEEEAILASDTQIFVYNTIMELKEAYPDLVDIQYLNVWEQPTIARKYNIVSSSAVVVKHGDSFRTCSPRDFFVFDFEDSSTPVGYCGEKRLAVAMKSVVDKNSPACYFTLNHGESFPDDAIILSAIDAGYSINYLDALSFEIPEDCALLITFNPSQDLTHTDGVSGTSEVDKLNAYMAKGGKHMVFASADTFAAGSFPHLESYLADWGVTFEHKPGEGGIEACYSIKDTAHALTTDGYTILGRIPDEGRGADLMTDIRDTVRVANATGIAIADGFTASGGDYVNGTRTVSPLLSTHPGAEAWVNGRAVDRTSTGYDLVTMTTDSASGAHLLVSSSVELASEAGLQSSAYDNAAFLLTALNGMGKDDAPVALSAQPFADDTIHILTTAQARTITLALTILPAALVLVAGLTVLIRRKFA